MNHPELLYEAPYIPNEAIYGIISVGHSPDTGEQQWAIVPYYSDAAFYGSDSMPEFLDRDNANAEVDEAIKAVRQ